MVGHSPKEISFINETTSIGFTSGEDGSFLITNLQITKGLAGTFYLLITDNTDRFYEYNELSNCSSNLLE